MKRRTITASDSVGRRFAEKIDFTGDCWLWTGAVTKDGYGTFEYSGTRYAHRFSYELLVGPIPKRLTLDHLCRTRHCVRPDHLEPVSIAENNRRGVEARFGRPASRGERRFERAALADHCVRGHQFDEANTLISAGRRVCRECNRIRARASYWRRHGREDVVSADPLEQTRHAESFGLTGASGSMRVESLASARRLPTSLIAPDGGVGLLDPSRDTTPHPTTGRRRI